ncbi:MAG: S8 family serine peptidase [Vicinamibacterales bacterium]|nr:S8 family serine peptidase [Vicinamibacterales bacterium]
MTHRLTLAAALGTLLLTPLAATAQQDYVVTAERWGAAQTAAVEAAGGTVVFGHDNAGVAVVRSQAGDFAARLAASEVVSSVTADMMVQWQRPSAAEQQIEADFTNPLNNDRFFNTVQWAPQAIDAPAAWALGCTGAGVRVAVLDGGLFNGHPDLAPNVDVGASRSFVPGQPFNADTGTFWHGTHVAGIIAAIDHDPAVDVNSGVIGIAPKATLVGVKVLHGGSGSFAWVIEGILYAATPQAQGGAGADIINMSLGALFSRSDAGAGELVAAMNKAVNFANRYGVLVVSAAGNNGLNLDHAGDLYVAPAESGSGIAVSSTGPMGFALGATDFERPASYSNYGTSVVHVAAPGGDFELPGNDLCTLPTTNGAPVIVPCWAFDMVLSTTRTGWGWAAGTSMAAPAASAVAAMIKQQNPGISLGRLKTALANSAVDHGKEGRDPFYGRGWVNALRACQY